MLNHDKRTITYYQNNYLHKCDAFRKNFVWFEFILKRYFWCNSEKLISLFLKSNTTSADGYIYIRNKIYYGLYQNHNKKSLLKFHISSSRWKKVSNADGSSNLQFLNIIPLIYCLKSKLTELGILKLTATSISNGIFWDASQLQMLIMFLSLYVEWLLSIESNEWILVFFKQFTQKYCGNC